MEQLVYKLALTFIPGIGPVLGRRLVSWLGGYEQVFRADEKQLLKVPGVGEKLSVKNLREKALERAEREMQALDEYNITPLFYLDNDYPEALTYFEDSPLVLYAKGDLTTLQANYILAVVGTRKPTLYGKQVCKKIITDLVEAGVRPVIVSGLAYGIDYCAHQTALELGLKTVAVLANGLDTVYPSSHRNIARKIEENGLLLSENPVNTRLEPKLFVRRNRIIAGLARATLIVESGSKGGALITANYSNIYKKTTFAIPGRINDEKSAGCNWLIKNNQAILLDSAAQLIETMKWTGKPRQAKISFLQLTPDEQQIVELLQQQEKVQVDEFADKLGWDFNKILSTLFGLELKAIVEQLPGNFYALKSL